MLIVKSYLLQTSNACLELELYGEVGHSVVLLPGAGGGIRGFREIGNELSNFGYKVAAMNYRGAGESTGVLNPLTMHDLAGDVAAVIEYLGAPALVLGWAFGNRVARCTASDFPDLVEKLILVCAGGQVEPDPKVYQRLWQSYDRSLTDEVRKSAVQETLFAPGNEVPEWFFDSRSKEAADASRLALQSTPPIEWQPGGDKPMLVIQGAYDKVAVPENAEILRRNWPDRVKVEIVENAGHAVLIERPREVAEIIKKYLS
jgi:pimeloyl-ACP methyl ester carboxylesterase